MACLADINVSRGSVATYARCGEIFNMHLTANLRRNLPVKNFVNRSRFDRIMVTSLWPSFSAHPIYTCTTDWSKYCVDFLGEKHLQCSERPVLRSTELDEINLRVDDASTCNTLIRRHCWLPIHVTTISFAHPRQKWMELNWAWLLPNMVRTADCHLLHSSLHRWVATIWTGLKLFLH